MEKQLLGYVYRKDGMHSQPLLLDSSPENIAVFIARAASTPKLVITDMLDLLVINTIGNFIDKCENYNYLQEVLKYLLPLQENPNNALKKELKYKALSCDAYSDEEGKEMLTDQLINEFNYNPL